MKDSEFIELLNLYLDHEISAADAARLEAEVQSDANRRRVYHDYCRMQKACKLLAQDFATEPSTESEPRVVAFEQRSEPNSRRQLGYAAAGLFAAAACIAMVLIGRTHVNPENSTAPSTVAVQDTPKALPVQAVAVAAPAAAGVEQPANELSPRNPEHASGLVFAARQTDPHLAWIQNVQLTPVQVPTQLDALHLESNSALRTDERTYTSGNKPLPLDVRSTAIRFQR
jgi:anti-sigma factor RsiW